MDNKSSSDSQPYISAGSTLPEITVKAVLLGIILSAVLAAANAYLGLYAGMTVSASIPAAVMSMGLLRMIGGSNILENNIVQTSASAGESLAAGAIFTLPALVLMGYWQEFNYWEVTLITASGGVLGVLFTIPLRNALIVRQRLTFPEGVATSEVLKSGEESGGAMKVLLLSGLAGGLFKMAQAGFNLWNGAFETAHMIGKKVYAYIGVEVSPALVAVGYIVGLNIAILVFLGGIISWWFAIPIHIALNGLPEGISDLAQGGGVVWNSQIRYLGVGAMLVGGVWAIISVRSSLSAALRGAINAICDKVKNQGNVLRTELDTPMSWVFIGIGVLIVPIFIVYATEIHQVEITVLMTVCMIVAGFLFSAVAGYMAGLVGSSNNPISGVTIATILSTALILLALLGNDSSNGPAAAILIGAVVCCAAAIAGDNMQDLKAGYLLGATPRKQQIMQMIGVLSAAVVIAPVLSLLLQGYGIGPPTEAQPASLSAPQATLMQSVADGVFGGNLPWGMISIGALIGLVVILIDLQLQRRNSSFRAPVLAVAVGIYLPFELDSAIFLGGVLAWVIERRRGSLLQSSARKAEKRVGESRKLGLLFASGLITGEALMGIVLAIPAALNIDGLMRLVESPPLGATPGMILLAGIAWWMYRQSVQPLQQK